MFYFYNFKLTLLNYTIFANYTNYINNLSFNKNINNTKLYL